MWEDWQVGGEGEREKEGSMNRVQEKRDNVVVFYINVELFLWHF